MSSGAGGGRPFAADLLTDLFHHSLDPGYADAARRRARSGPRTGWRLRCTRGVALLVLTVLGFLLAVAYRQTLAEEPARVQTRAGLLERVQSRQAQTGALQRQAQQLRGEVAALRDAALTDTAVARLRDLEAMTGLAPVRGDAVVIRLADGPPPADAAGSNKPNLGRVMDRDLQDVANALWVAGAEAIAINGQRLTATSTIRTAGQAILVDILPVLGPYEVSALGPEDLAERFGKSPAAAMFRQLVGEVGMSFEVRRAEDVTLPAGAPRLRHARTLPPPSPTASRPSPAASRPSGVAPRHPAGAAPTGSTPVNGGPTGRAARPAGSQEPFRSLPEGGR